MQHKITKTLAAAAVALGKPLLTAAVNRQAATAPLFTCQTSALPATRTSHSAI